MSFLSTIERATGKDKFTVIGAQFDVLMELAESRSIDEKIATLDVEELAKSHDVAFDTMRNQLRSVLGRNAVFRLGKRWLVRKAKFLEFLQTLERDDTA